MALQGCLVNEGCTRLFTWSVNLAISLGPSWLGSLTLLLLLTLHPRPRLIGQTDTLYADLDRSAGNEMILLTDLSRQADFDVYADTTAWIEVFRWRENRWVPWEIARGPAMVNQENRLSVSVQRGALVITHANNGYNYYELTYRYRYQRGRMQLIGLTRLIGEKFGLATTLDYNLSTGAYTYDEKSFADLNSEDEENANSTLLFHYSGRNRPPLRFYLDDERLPSGSLTVEGRGEISF